MRPRAIIDGHVHWGQWKPEREGWPGKEVHAFDLCVNGEPWFTFQNRKDAEAKKWTVTGKHGAELSFDAQIADHAAQRIALQVPGVDDARGNPAARKDALHAERGGYRVVVRKVMRLHVDRPTL
jgi:hypothetical protein